MTVLTILGVLATLAAVGGFSYWIHAYSVDRYNYEPFSKTNLLFMLIPIGLFWGATFFVAEGETIITAVQGGNLDTILMLALAVLSIVGFVAYVSSQSNLGIALGAAIVQFAAAVVIIAVLFLIAILLSGQKKKGQS